MCGIVAHIGNNCVENLLDGIKALRNRGYDGAGICKIVDTKLRTYKYASSNTTDSIDKLETEIHKDNAMMSPHISVGISHTRWSTHGGKTDANSHPHHSNDGKFAVVHNGIIENYKKMKDYLVGKGYIFHSQTDTEIVSSLLSYEYNTTNDIVSAIKRTFQQLSGTWGVAILCSDYPTKIFGIRHGSPLLISVTDDFAMIVSEQSGFCGKAQNYIVLKNHDLCILEHANGGEIMMTCENIYENHKINCEISEKTPHPYPHWTIKEIMEQDETAFRAISLGGRIDKNEKVKLGGLDDNKKTLKKITNLIILGCGTSHYAGALGVHYFRDLCRFNTVQAIDAAEFSEKDIPLMGNTALIMLSQSGETSDLYKCVEIAKRNGIFMIGVVNVVDSMIAREVNCGCYLNAGREVAVASTKSFTSQVIILSMIAIWFAQLNGINIEKRKNYIADLRKLNLDIRATINGNKNAVKSLVPFFEDKPSCFLLGKGRGEAIVKEAALKIKELSRIHAEGYSTSSLKHGPFALLEEKYPVIMIGTSSCSTESSKIENAYQEIDARHANIIFITDKPECVHPNRLIVENNSTYAELLAVIPLQLLSYYLALERGINPDMPRNLAKVVTVE